MAGWLFLELLWQQSTCRNNNHCFCYKITAENKSLGSKKNNLKPNTVMSVAIVIYKGPIWEQYLGAWQDSNHVHQPQHTTPSCLAMQCQSKHIGGKILAPHKLSSLISNKLRKEENLPNRSKYSYLNPRFILQTNIIHDAKYVIKLFMMSFND